MIIGIVIQLLILAGIGWGVVSLVKLAQRSGTTRRLEGNDHRAQPIASGPPPERSATMEVDGRRGDAVPPSLTQQLSPKALRDQRLLELKNRYVDDDISVEQYEAELDKLLREPGE